MQHDAATQHCMSVVINKVHSVLLHKTITADSQNKTNSVALSPRANYTD
jgi:hypothetical protein